MNKASILMTSAIVVASVAATAHAQQLDGSQHSPFGVQARLGSAQQGQQVAGQQVADDARATARRWGVGVFGGVGIDPEIIDVGAHGTIGPIFNPNFSFRPGIEIGAGEITTFLGLNFDVVYSFPGSGSNEWFPYIGAGPTFGLSHRGFGTDDTDNVDSDVDRNRFDFSDTDFNGGMNFVVGMRKPSGVFFEMKATAWGVSNIRLVGGFNF